MENIYHKLLNHFPNIDLQENTGDKKKKLNYTTKGIIMQI